MAGQQGPVRGEGELLQPGAEMTREPRHQLHRVLSHKRLAAGDAQLVHTEGGKSRHEFVELLKTQQILSRQEGHTLRHAINAAKIAPVGDRQAQITDAPTIGVDQPGRRPHGRRSAFGR